MNERKLPPFIAIAICLELMLAPLPAIAQDGKKPDPIGKVSNTLLDVTSIGAGVFNTYNQAKYGNNQQASQANQQGLQMLQDQRNPLPDRYFNAQLIQATPGLSQYLATHGIPASQLICNTLPASLTEADVDVCRSPKNALNGADLFYNEYSEIAKTYDNYLKTSNVEAQPYGIGCMNNAQNVLKGFFEYRSNELDKLITQIEAAQAKFKEDSKMDMNAIEESTAILLGKDGGEITEKVKTRNADLLNFGKRFNNPACGTIFSSNDFDNQGKDTGLKGIQTILKDEFTKPADGATVSGEGYASAHAAIVTDINQMADKVAKQAELNFDAITEGGLPGFLANLSNSVSSQNGVNKSLQATDKFADLNLKFNEKYKKLQSERSDINSELSGFEADNALGLVNKVNDGSFENEVASIENRIKTKCLESNIGSIDTVLEKIYDPNASKFANDNNSGFLKNKIREAIENKNTSLDKKLAELKAIDAQNKNRYFLKLDSSYEIQDVNAKGELTRSVVSPHTRRSPSMYFSDVIRNCEAQFKVNKLGNKMSGKAAIEKLRKLNQDFKSLAKSNAQELKSTIINKMLVCDNNAAVKNQAGSCNSDSFNTSSATFCANKAMSCSQNMKSCTDQANKFVTELETNREARINNYKGLVEKNKAEMNRILDTALASFMRDGDMLRSAFNIGFVSPAGIKRDIEDGEQINGTPKFLAAFMGLGDNKLMLEDPNAYMEMTKKNIIALKGQVEEQQGKILQEVIGPHIDLAQDNFVAVRDAASKIAGDCDQAYRDADDAASMAEAEAMKQHGELSGKMDQFCRRYKSGANGNPICNGIDDLYTSVESALGNGAAAAQNILIMCSERESANSAGGDADDLCDNYEVEAKLTPYCRKLDKAREIVVDPKDEKKEKEREREISKAKKDIEKQYKAWRKENPSDEFNEAKKYIANVNPSPSFCHSQNNSLTRGLGKGGIFDTGLGQNPGVSSSSGIGY